MGNFLFKCGAVIFMIGFIPCIVGFGCQGIRGDSYASGIQSSIGNVETGSGFSICTSLGMHGTFICLMIIGGLLLYLGYLLQ